MALDTVLLDLGGLERLLGPAEEAGRRMADRAAQLGLEAHVAVAQNIHAALQAARGFAGVTLIPPGQERERLRSLPLEVLEPPTEFLETLHRWGIRTLRDLAELSTVQLAERLGQGGVELQTRAGGTAWRPLVPAQPDLQFEEIMELDHAIEQLESLAFALGVLLNRLCARLQARALVLHEPLVEMNLEVRSETEPVEAPPHSTYEKRLRLPVPTERGVYSVRCAREPASLCVESERGLWNHRIAFYALDLSRGKGRKLAETHIDLPVDQTNWDLSPDGSKIAIVVSNEPSGRVRVLSLVGGRPRDFVVQGRSGLQSMDWAGDGKGVYVSSRTARGTRSLFTPPQGIG